MELLGDRVDLIADEGRHRVVERANGFGHPEVEVVHARRLERATNCHLGQPLTRRADAVDRGRTLLRLPERQSPRRAEAVALRGASSRRSGQYGGGYTVRSSPTGSA